MAKHVLDFEYGAAGEYSWVECSCGLTRLDPMPSENALRAAYPPDYHAYVQPKALLTRYLIRMSRLRLAKSLSSMAPQGGTVLDIGCSSGELLQAMKRYGNFELWGVESNRKAAKLAEEKGIRVWHGEFEQHMVPAQSADLILLQHTLEHLWDPSRALAECFRILRPSGRVVIEVPNFSSWDRMLFGRYWGGGHAPRHLWHFTPRTLESMCRSAGLSKVRVVSCMHTGHWALSVQNFLRRNRRTSEGLNRGRAWYYPVLLLAALPVNALQFAVLKTGVMRVQARRP
jgi:SAM-dependent methyltransferase